MSDATPAVHLAIEGLVAVAFSPDGRWLATKNRPCRLWEVGTWREVRRIGDTGLCFSPDGRLLLVREPGEALRLVEAETGHTLARLRSPDLAEVWGAGFSPDGSRLVATNRDARAVNVWDLRAIRRHLVELGLDWEGPEFSGDDPADASAPPLPAPGSISGRSPWTLSNSPSRPSRSSSGLPHASGPTPTMPKPITSGPMP